MHTNDLIHESSPYLLQHAHNPVNWNAWKPEVLQRAKDEDKLILVSIGYSACHWCHVMEHESFEDEAVAAIMNAHFINIKIDREERPDIDMVYMTAVQLMSGQGGWPLNCFVLPDGRAVYGGTYFQKAQWMEILQNLAQLYKNDKNKVLEYAARLHDGLEQTELSGVIDHRELAPITEGLLLQAVVAWKTRLDNEEGGPGRAPKFPLPNNYLYLLQHAHLFGDNELMAHVQLTLEKMAKGGIYDQLGGGFARYSTDMDWKVPHFEKMLYDNAQLVTLYSEAYRQSKNELYKEVIEQTLDFVARELTSPEHAFYSALDADSEGEEGKFYVWQQEELQSLLGGDYEVFAAFYQVNDRGYWEHDNYILMRCDNESEVAVAHGLSLQALREKIKTLNARLLEARAKRVRPGLDDKTLTSWNALMCKGYADAYLALGTETYKAAALANANFIKSQLLNADTHQLLHAYKNGKATIEGFLEDYAFVIEAWMQVYMISGDESWLQEARALCDYCLEQFYDAETGLFYFTDKRSEALVVRKKELSDNVVPASNSQMALNLFALGHYFGNADYRLKAQAMLSTQAEEFVRYGAGYSNWGLLMLREVFPFYELAVVGKSVNEKLLELHQSYVPNLIFAGSEQASELELLKNRYVEGRTLIYVCRNNACQLPVGTVAEALKQMR